ncbi:DUF4181 domain-containing protein [Bacillus salacetis]|uniref:DUF4181 domain-containing protein n=1 Tax=Bacillus salacetis TaxID=2315464 RepID=A0A3A1R5A1_9BACI|nr:DUF4181 domain-containing protein [Bacillus salacetis]RIW37276.1 DUF4181 domain-containing protein [Bacillus salacetis]
MKFILFIIMVFAVFGILNKLLGKWLGKDERKIADTEGKMLDRWGRGALLLIFLFILTRVNDMPDANAVMGLYWLIFIILIFGFQSFMEWKYLKGSKEYIKTLIFLGLALSFLGLLYAFRSLLV